MLKLVDVAAGYGPVVILRSISLEIQRGSVIAVIGANGAGKTTLLRTISGLTDVVSGTIEFEGRNIVGVEPYKIARLGIAHVPERRELFPELTVAQNLVAGAYSLKDRRRIAECRERVLTYFPVLADRMGYLAGTLSGGEQQMLAIGRGLMASPSLIVLDEPSLGLAPLVISQIFEIVEKLNRDEGLTTLIVEQNVKLSLGISQHAYVMASGRIVHAGTSEELAENEMVVRSYLGTPTT